MSNDPDKIRADIERTRAELSSDVDALSEKVSPSSIVERRKEKVRSSLGSVKDRVMGSAQGAKDTAQGATQSATQSAHGATEQVRGTAHDTKEHLMDTMHDAKASLSSTASDLGSSAADLPHKVRTQTEGNPLAVGLIAFGAGWLVASLLPASRKEQQAALAAKEQAAPLLEGAKGLGSEIAEHLREPAQGAVQAVKDSATEAVSALKDEGRSEAEGLQGDAMEAKDTVQQQRSQ